MFTPTFYIELLQTTKKSLTDKLITDPVVNKACHSFMDAQLALGKTMTNNLVELTEYSVKSMTKAFYPKTVEATPKKVKTL